MQESPPPAPVLITGAAGFIGGEMARHFATGGIPTAGWDLPGKPVGHLDACAVPFHAGDVTVRADCDEILRRVKPGAIVHCAAAMGGSTPRQEFMRVNLGGTRTLAEAAVACGVRRLVFISSVTVHGMPPSDGIHEGTEIRSIGLPYADSKIATEEILRAHQARGELDVTVLRPADVYGPRSGEWVVKLVEALRAGKMLLIAGGRGLINITYVDNLCDAVRACLVREESVGREYLITDGSPVTWRRYLSDLASAAGAPPPRISVPTAVAWPLVVAMEAVFPLLGRRPPLGRLGLRLLTSRSAYSIHRARKELGWEPAVTYEEGMRRVADWVREAIPAGEGGKW
jgi:nucleoside-diphosphate-sugar epimerase